MMLLQPKAIQKSKGCECVEEGNVYGLRNELCAKVIYIL
jgi:hypothetical protein